VCKNLLATQGIELSTLDISNKSLAKIIEKFIRTLTVALKELKDFNSKNLFDVSENARRDTLDVMLQLCQRLHTSAPIRNVKKTKEQTPAKEPESKCSIHTYQPSSSTLSVQIQVHNYTGDDLQDVLDRMPKADPVITVSGPSFVVSHTAGKTPLLVSQSAYTQGSCQCSYFVPTPDTTSFHQSHATEDTSSPLKKRFDELDKNFGSVLKSVIAEPPSIRPKTYPPPSTPQFVSKQPQKTPLDNQSQQWHSWSPAPSIMSSTLPASAHVPSRSLISDLVYSQPRTTSLQEKLNAMTQAMISTKLESTVVPSAPSLLSMRSGFLPVLQPRTSHLLQTPIPTTNDRRGQVWQWAESVETDSIAPGPSSVSGASTTASFAFPGVLRYAGSVRMTGGLPTPPPE
jgi:hypothetical protein